VRCLPRISEPLKVPRNFRSNDKAGKRYNCSDVPVLSKRRPLIAILENVENLILTGQADAALTMLRGVGYVAAYTLSNPMFYGCPQSRARVYFVCIRADWLPDGWADANFDRLFTEMFGLLRVGHQLGDLESFLLPDSHPRVVEHLRHVSSRGQTLDGEVSMRLKCDAEAKGSGMASNWSHALMAQFPGFARLSERHRQLLDDRGTVFPEVYPRILNLSQRSGSDFWACSPCIIPHGVYYLAHRVRTMIGDEAFRFQYIHIPDNICARYKQQFLLDLAGNSFSAADCSAAILVGLALISDAFACKLSIVVSVPAPMCSVSDGGDDSESDASCDFSKRRRHK